MSREKRPGIGDLLLPGLNAGASAVTGESDELARETAELDRRFERAIVQLREQRTARDREGMEQTDKELIYVLVRFLDLHANDKKLLPRFAANILKNYLKDALAGHPTACLTRRSKNNSPMVRTAELWAVGCIKHAQSGRIVIPEPIKTVADLFKVTQRSVRRWMGYLHHWDIVGLSLDRLPPNIDPTKEAREMLVDFAAVYRVAHAKPRRAGEIKQRGQRVIGVDRNRRAAGRAAGACSPVRHLNGEDPTFDIPANVHRRHMTKGQRAMVAAMAHPESERGGAKDRGSIAKNLGLSGEYIRQARIVLRFSLAQANAVLSGGKTLDAAYQEAKFYKAKADARARRRRRSV